METTSHGEQTPEPNGTQRPDGWSEEDIARGAEETARQNRLAKAELGAKILPKLLANLREVIRTSSNPEDVARAQQLLNQNEEKLARDQEIIAEHQRQHSAE